MAEGYIGFYHPPQTYSTGVFNSLMWQEWHKSLFNQMYNQVQQSAAAYAQQQAMMNAYTPQEANAYARYLKEFWGRQRARDARKATVEAVAEKLLVAHLNERQQKDLRERRSFEVIGPKSKHVYVIQHGWAGNIRVIDNKTGRLLETLCIHPTVDVPIPDNMLAQKLLLEADEEQFRRIANITRMARNFFS